jgi:hypothetical protein
MTALEHRAEERDAPPVPYDVDNCTICGKRDYLRPLHGTEGGPLCCLICLGKWHAEHGRRRKLGRIVIRAIAAYLDGGGKDEDIHKLGLAAKGKAYLNLSLDPLGYLIDTADANSTTEIIELTSEVLADAIKLTHPDQHAPERKELAHRVTQELLRLVPFTFPAPTPPKPEPVTDASRVADQPDKKPLQIRRLSYPCPECADTTPFHYCDACKAEWGRRNQEKRDRETAKQRARYARRRKRALAARLPKQCTSCGKQFDYKRADAVFCSARCRQRAHRKAPVTHKSNAQRRPSFMRDAERLILTALKYHPAIFLNDLLPPERTPAQYQALCRASRKLEEAGEIGSVSYWARFGKPGFLALVKPGSDPKSPDKIIRLSAGERQTIAVSAKCEAAS